MRIRPLPPPREKAKADFNTRIVLAACDSEVNERTYERSIHYYPGVAAHWGFADMALQLRLGILPEWRIRFDSGHRVNRFSTKIAGTEFQKERHRFGAPPVFQFLNLVVHTRPEISTRIF